MSVSEQIQQLKKDFYSYRNGVVASALRKSGDTHKYIMGCMLPDIVQITSLIQPNKELSDALWAEKEHRECRIAATMLYPVEEFNFNIALEWCEGVENHEIADVLCQRILRKTKYAKELWHILLQRENELNQYIGLRLLANLVSINREQLDENIKSSLNSYLSMALTPGLARFAVSIIEDS